MKKLATLLFLSLSLAALTACGQTKQPAQITFRIVDDLGQPVPGGTVTASTFSHGVRGEGFGHDVNDIYKAKIDQKGIAVLKGDSLTGKFTYSVEPTGSYYPGAGGKHRFTSSKSNRWEPWNPEVTVIVPRILTPIPLYVRLVGNGPNLELPNLGPVGFDLLVSDWVAPHGKGKKSDLIFTHTPGLRMADANAAFDSVFTLSFANEGDGIQSRPVSPPASSIKRLIELPREATVEGYEPKLERRISWAGAGTPPQLGVREDQNYFFRVRTVLDPNGKVVSALYGKIYGDIQFVAPPASPGMVSFTYYLNPTSLDRNLEFDYKRNLFKGRMDGILGHGP